MRYNSFFFLLPLLLPDQVKDEEINRWTWLEMKGVEKNMNFFHCKKNIYITSPHTNTQPKTRKPFIHSFHLSLLFNHLIMLRAMVIILLMLLFFYHSILKIIILCLFDGKLCILHCFICLLIFHFVWLCHRMLTQQSVKTNERVKPYADRIKSTEKKHSHQTADGKQSIRYQVWSSKLDEKNYDVVDVIVQKYSIYINNTSVAFPIQQKPNSPSCMIEFSHCSTTTRDNLLRQLGKKCIFYSKANIRIISFSFNK